MRLAGLEEGNCARYKAGAWRQIPLAVVTLIALAPTSVGAATLGKPDYRGDGQGGSTVAFRLATSDGERIAVFRAREVELFCEDLTQQRINLAPVKVPVRKAGGFETEIYSLEPNGGESFYEIKGRLRGGDRSTGSLHYVSDPVNPPGSGAPPDCDSLNVIWKAKHVIHD
jgi:hypothetical protein